MRCLVAGLMVLTTAAFAQAETPAFGPRSWKSQHIGPPTEVLTIGSAHLGQLKTVVTPEMLAPLLDKLAAFKPTIITHEGVSGEQCDVLKRYAVRYPGMFQTYCWAADYVDKPTGLTISAAMAEVEKTLSAWPASPTAAQRRRLASLFLAAGDRPSARVQWLQVPVEQRTTGDGIDEDLLKIVTRAGAKPNETYDIAVALAARLGLNRVYAVDDHTADSIQALAGPDLDKFLQSFWGSVKSPVYDEATKLENGLKTGSDMLSYYRFTNRPATLRAYVTLDYRRAMNTPSPASYGRVYNAWWDTRNLRMVSNIRAAFGNQPGARVLNVVGASHNAYYDAYLDMMADVKLIDAEAVLQ
jgi:hypothetical protein